MRGRKPKPTKLKILHASREPINEAEPRVDPSIPDAPACLSAEARREWDRVSVELGACGVLTQLDRGILTSYCVAWGRLIRALQETQHGGIMLKGKRAGGEYQNQWEAIVKRASAEVAKYGAELGLTPSSRSRVVVNQQTADPFAEFQRRAAAARRENVG